MVALLAVCPRTILTLPGGTIVRRSPEQLQREMDGLLAFVHTPFTGGGEVDVPRFRQHLRYLADAFPDRPTSYWVCCGSGEFWSLALAEYATLVRAAVEEVGSEAPVVAGVGYGTRLALEFVRIAEEQGADGLLIFPPYLVGGPQEGLLEHYAAMAASTRLAIAVYHRDNAIFEPETVARLVERYPHMIGLKDGVGDLGCLARMRNLLGERFLLMNGMPSAEVCEAVSSRGNSRLLAGGHRVHTGAGLGAGSRACSR
jgi:5-dehydro-4-deoxyglucarate dehydratase